jgi:hypothetical protein
MVQRTPVRLVWIQVFFFSKHLAWAAALRGLPGMPRPQNIVVEYLPSPIFGIKSVPLCGQLRRLADEHRM